MITMDYKIIIKTYVWNCPMQLGLALALMIIILSSPIWLD